MGAGRANADREWVGARSDQSKSSRTAWTSLRSFALPGWFDEDNGRDSIAAESETIVALMMLSGYAATDELTEDT